MTHVSQHLHDAFPEQAALITRLKADDSGFQDLAARFEAIDTAVHAADAGDDPASDERTEGLKKERLAVLDAIAAYLETKD
jgi:uncharacterized protein YdcH (DUF465 family)